MEQISGMPMPRVSERAPGTEHRMTLLRALKKYRFYYLLLLPGLVYLLIFKYGPMFGIVIAFKDVSPFSGIDGILHDPFVGLKHFRDFTSSYFLWNILGNTVIISLLKLVWTFPAPIILALLINEVGSTVFKRGVQTISYLPYFLSTVVVVGLLQMLVSVDGGLINQLLYAMGRQRIPFLSNPDTYRSILVGMSLWQGVGWGSILYLAAMANISPELYEAAMIDGANRFHQIRHITLPGISHIIVLLLIFQIGALLNAGFEQVLLTYSPAVYSVGDIIDTYVYRSGLQAMKYSYATAVGVFKSVVATLLVLGANKLAHLVGQEGIW